MKVKALIEWRERIGWSQKRAAQELNLALPFYKVVEKRAPCSDIAVPRLELACEALHARANNIEGY